MPGRSTGWSSTPIPCPSRELRSLSCHGRVSSRFRSISGCLQAHSLFFFSLLTACLGKAGQALLFNPCSAGCGRGSGAVWVQVGAPWCSLAVPRSEAGVGLPVRLPGQLCCAAAETRRYSVNHALTQTLKKPLQLH